DHSLSDKADPTASARVGSRELPMSSREAARAEESGADRIPCAEDNPNPRPGTGAKPAAPMAMVVKSWVGVCNRRKALRFSLLRKPEDALDSLLTTSRRNCTPSGSWSW